MPMSEFLKNLPCTNEANFSNANKDVHRIVREKPKVIRNVAHTADEKKIICDKKPFLLQFLQNKRNGRAERKRTSEPSTGEENDAAVATQTKSRRRE